MLMMFNVQFDASWQNVNLLFGIRHEFFTSGSLLAICFALICWPNISLKPSLWRRPAGGNKIPSTRTKLTLTFQNRWSLWISCNFQFVEWLSIVGKLEREILNVEHWQAVTCCLRTVSRRWIPWEVGMRSKSGKWATTIKIPISELIPIWKRANTNSVHGR